jgi:hypothetical protein
MELNRDYFDKIIENGDVWQAYSFAKTLTDNNLLSEKDKQELANVITSSINSFTSENTNKNYDAREFDFLMQTCMFFARDVKMQNIENLENTYTNACIKMGAIQRLYDFFLNVPNASSKLFNGAIANFDIPFSVKDNICYECAKNIKNADKRLMEQVVIKGINGSSSKNFNNNVCVDFARDIDGADKKAIFNEALKSNNTNLILEFAVLNKELGLTKPDLKRICERVCSIVKDNAHKFYESKINDLLQGKYKGSKLDNLKKLEESKEIYKIYSPLLGLLYINGVDKNIIYDNILSSKNSDICTEYAKIVKGNNFDKLENVIMANKDVKGAINFYRSIPNSSYKKTYSFVKENGSLFDKLKLFHIRHLKNKDLKRHIKIVTYNCNNDQSNNGSSK